jgi:hypothetical protein
VRCLFVTCRKDPDYISSCTWDGLQEVLGEDNVVDAVNSPWLHKSSLDAMYGTGPHPEVRAISGSREGVSYKVLQSSGYFDLIVLHACFVRDLDWQWVKDLKGINPRAKVAYVEGWDAAWDVTRPEIPVDAYFRREINDSIPYPMRPHHLSFAMPERMFPQTTPKPSALDWARRIVEQIKAGEPLPPRPTEWWEGDRPYDVFFAGNPRSCHPDRPVRWRMLRELFSTHTMHHSIACTGTLGGWEPYWEIMRQSKLALVPPGADDCESLRCYEAAAAGAIPILLCYPAYRREPWFPPETCFECGLDGLADCIDHALSNDQTARRQALLEYARKHHTTRARAEKLLKVMGML